MSLLRKQVAFVRKVVAEMSGEFVRDSAMGWLRIVDSFKL